MNYSGIYSRTSPTKRTAFDIGRPRHQATWLHPGRIPLYCRRNGCADSIIVYVQQEACTEPSRVESKEQSEDGNGDLLEVHISLFDSPLKRVLIFA